MAIRFKSMEPAFFMTLSQKLSRILFFVALGVLVLLTVFHFFIDPLAERFLKKQISTAGKGKYQLYLEDLHVSVLKGDILVKGLRIETDTTRNLSGPFISSDVENVAIQGVSWLRIFTNDQLILDNLTVKNVNLQLILHQDSLKEPSKEPFSLEQLDVYPLIKDIFKKVKIDQLGLINIHFEMVVRSPKDTVHLSLEQLDIHSQEILVDADHLFTPSRSFYAEQLSIEGRKLEMKKSGTEGTEAKAGSLYFFSRENKAELVVEGMTFQQHGKEGSEPQLFFQLRKLLVQELNLRKLQEEKTAELQKVWVNQLEFKSQSVQETEYAEKDEKERNTLKQNSLKKFSLGSLLPPFLTKINLAELEVTHLFGTHGKTLAINDGNLKAFDFVVDKSPAFANQHFFHALEMASNVGELHISGGEPLHHATFSNVSFKAGEGISSLEVGHFLLLPSIKTNGTNWVELEIAHVLLDNLDTRRIPSGSLTLGRLAIEGPDVVIYSNQTPGQEEEKAKELNDSFNLAQMDVYPLIKPYLDQIAINDLSIRDMKGKLFSRNKNGNILIYAPHLQLLSKGVLIGENLNFTDSRAFYGQEMDLKATNLFLKQEYPNQREVNLGALHGLIKHTQAEINLKNLSFFQPAKGKQDTLKAIQLGGLLMKGLNLDELLQANKAKVESLVLHDLDIANYQEVQKKEDQEEKDSAALQTVSIQDLNLSNYLPEIIQEVELGDFKLQNVSYFQKPEVIKVKEGGLEAKGISINQKPAFAEGSFLHAKYMEGSLKNASYTTSGEVEHSVRLKALNFEVVQGTGTLSIQHFAAAPINSHMNSEWLEMEIPSISLTGIHTKELSSGSLAIDSFTIEKPFFVVHSPAGTSDTTTNRKTKNQAPPNLYPFVKDHLKSLLVKNIALTNGDLRFSGLGGSYYGLHIPLIHVRVEDLLVAPETAFTDKRLLHSSEIQVKLEDLVYIFPDKVYTLQLDGAQLDTSEKNLELNGFRYVYSDNYKEKLAEKKTNEVYKVDSRKLLAEEVNYEKLFKGNGFESAKVISEGLELYVYKDFNVPYEEQIKPMPATIVHNLKTPIAIKELILREMEVTYEEMKEGADTAGFITIEAINGSIHDLSNVDSILQQYPSMEVVASGRLMGKGYFQSHINVPLLDKTQKVRVTGTMDTLDITELNRIARYNSMLAIEKGYFYKVSWDFEAGEDQSNGKMEVSYENLKVQLSQPNSPDTTGLIKDVGSWLINMVVVDSNLAEGKEEKPEEVTFEQTRDKERSFFHFYVQSLLAGLIEAIGVPFQ